MNTLTLQETALVNLLDQLTATLDATATDTVFTAIAVDDLIAWLGLAMTALGTHEELEQAAHGGGSLPVGE